MRPAAVAMRACATMLATPPVTVAARKDCVAEKEKAPMAEAVLRPLVLAAESIHPSVGFLGSP